MNKNSFFLAISFLVLLTNLRAQDLYVGIDSSGNTTNLTPDLSYYYDYTYIGYNSEASNNSLVNPGAVFNNSQDISIGYFGSANSLIVSNAGFLQVSGSGYIGNQETSSNNLMLIKNTSEKGVQSEGDFNGDLNIGYSGSGNGAIISDGGLMLVNGDTFLGHQTTSSNNFLSIEQGPDSGFTFNGDLNVGYAGSGNSLVVSNAGGCVSYNGALNIGYLDTSSNNSMIVTGVLGSYTSIAAFLNNDINLGYSGSSNSVIVSNGGRLIAVNCYIGNQNNSSNNYLLINGISYNGLSSTLFLSGDMTLGYGGSGNTLIISNGGQLFDSNGWISYTNEASNNTLLVAGSNSLWTNAGSLTIGSTNSSGTLIISDNAQVRATNIFVQNGLLSFNATSPVGSSTVTLGASNSTNTPLLLITTNATIDTLNYHTNGQLVVSEATEQILTINGALTLENGINSQVYFTLLDQSPLNNHTINLLKYATNSNSSLTTNNFTVANLEGVTIQFVESSGFITVQATANYCGEITLTNSLTVSNYTVACGYLNIASNGILTATNVTVESPGTLKGDGVINIEGGDLNIYGTFAPNVGN